MYITRFEIDDKVMSFLQVCMCMQQSHAYISPLQQRTGKSASLFREEHSCMDFKIKMEKNSIEVETDAYRFVPTRVV